jgi:hypothetical protein
MADRRLRIEVVGRASIALDDVEKLPTLPHQMIHIEKADFRDLMSINMVAITLRRSVRQVRRMIESGAFPSSLISRGQTQYWLRQTVREWKKSQLRTSSSRSRQKAKSARWSSVDEIVTEEEREFTRKATDTQKLIDGERGMRTLFASDRKEFERQHPNLRRWLKERGF